MNSTLQVAKARIRAGRIKAVAVGSLFAHALRTLEREGLMAVFKSLNYRIAAKKCRGEAHAFAPRHPLAARASFSRPVPRIR